MLSKLSYKLLGQCKLSGPWPSDLPVQALCLVVFDEAQGPKVVDNRDTPQLAIEIINSLGHMLLPKSECLRDKVTVINFGSCGIVFCPIYITCNIYKRHSFFFSVVALVPHTISLPTNIRDKYIVQFDMAFRLSSVTPTYYPSYHTVKLSNKQVCSHTVTATLQSIISNNELYQYNENIVDSATNLARSVSPKYPISSKRSETERSDGMSHNDKRTQVVAWLYRGRNAEVPSNRKEIIKDRKEENHEFEFSSTMVETKTATTSLDYTAPIFIGRSTSRHCAISSELRCAVDCIIQRQCRAFVFEVAQTLKRLERETRVVSETCAKKFNSRTIASALDLLRKAYNLHNMVAPRASFSSILLLGEEPPEILVPGPQVFSLYEYIKSGIVDKKSNNIKSTSDIRFIPNNGARRATFQYFESKNNIYDYKKKYLNQYYSQKSLQYRYLGYVKLKRPVMFKLKDEQSLLNFSLQIDKDIVKNSSDQYKIFEILDSKSSHIDTVQKKDFNKVSYKQPKNDMTKVYRYLSNSSKKSNNLVNNKNLNENITINDIIKTKGIQYNETNNKNINEIIRCDCNTPFINHSQNLKILSELDSLKNLITNITYIDKKFIDNNRNLINAAESSSLILRANYLPNCKWSAPRMAAIKAQWLDESWLGLLFESSKKYDFSNQASYFWPQYKPAIAKNMVNYSEWLVQVLKIYPTCSTHGSIEPCDILIIHTQLEIFSRAQPNTDSILTLVGKILAKSVLTITEIEDMLKVISLRWNKFWGAFAVLTLASNAAYNSAAVSIVEDILEVQDSSWLLYNETDDFEALCLEWESLVEYWEYSLSKHILPHLCSWSSTTRIALSIKHRDEIDKKFNQTKYNISNPQRSKLLAKSLQSPTFSDSSNIHSIGFKSQYDVKSIITKRVYILLRNPWFYGLINFHKRFTARIKKKILQYKSVRLVGYTNYYRRIQIVTRSRLLLNIYSRKICHNISYCLFLYLGMLRINRSDQMFVTPYNYYMENSFDELYISKENYSVDDKYIDEVNIRTKDENVELKNKCRLSNNILILDDTIDGNIVNNMITENEYYDIVPKILNNNKFSVKNKIKCVQLQTEKKDYNYANLNSLPIKKYQILLLRLILKNCKLSRLSYNINRLPVLIKEISRKKLKIVQNTKSFKSNSKQEQHFDLYLSQYSYKNEIERRNLVRNIALALTNSDTSSTKPPNESASNYLQTIVKSMEFSESKPSGKPTTASKKILQLPGPESLISVLRSLVIDELSDFHNVNSSTRSLKRSSKMKKKINLSVSVQLRYKRNNIIKTSLPRWYRQSFPEALKEKMVNWETLMLPAQSDSVIKGSYPKYGLSNHLSREASYKNDKSVESIFAQNLETRKYLSFDDIYRIKNNSISNRNSQKSMLYKNCHTNLKRSSKSDIDLIYFQPEDIWNSQSHISDTSTIGGKDINTIYQSNVNNELDQCLENTKYIKEKTRKPSEKLQKVYKSSRLNDYLNSTSSSVSHRYSLNDSNFDKITSDFINYEINSSPNSLFNKKQNSSTRNTHSCNIYKEKGFSEKIMNRDLYSKKDTSMSVQDSQSSTKNKQNISKSSSVNPYWVEEYLNTINNCNSRRSLPTMINRTFIQKKNINNSKYNIDNNDENKKDYSSENSGISFNMSKIYSSTGTKNFSQNLSENLNMLETISYSDDRFSDISSTKINLNKNENYKSTSDNEKICLINYQRKNDNINDIYSDVNSYKNSLEDLYGSMKTKFSLNNKYFNDKNVEYITSQKNSVNSSIMSNTGKKFFKDYYEIDCEENINSTDNISLSIEPCITEIKPKAILSRLSRSSNSSILNNRNSCQLVDPAFSNEKRSVSDVYSRNLSNSLLTSQEKSYLTHSYKKKFLPVKNLMKQITISDKKRIQKSCIEYDIEAILKERTEFREFYYNLKYKKNILSIPRSHSMITYHRLDTQLGLYSFKRSISNIDNLSIISAKWYNEPRKSITNTLEGNENNKSYNDFSNNRYLTSSKATKSMYLKESIMDYLHDSGCNLSNDNRFNMKKNSSLLTSRDRNSCRDLLTSNLCLENKYKLNDKNKNSSIRVSSNGIISKLPSTSSNLSSFIYDYDNDVNNSSYISTEQLIVNKEETNYIDSSGDQKHGNKLFLNIDKSKPNKYHSTQYDTSNYYDSVLKAATFRVDKNCLKSKYKTIDPSEDSSMKYTDKENRNNSFSIKNFDDFQFIPKKWNQFKNISDESIPEVISRYSVDSQFSQESLNNQSLNLPKDKLSNYQSTISLQNPNKELFQKTKPTTKKDFLIARASKPRLWDINNPQAALLAYRQKQLDRMSESESNEIWTPKNTPNLNQQKYSNTMIPVLYNQISGQKQPNKNLYKNRSDIYFSADRSFKTKKLDTIFSYTGLRNLTRPLYKAEKNLSCISDNYDGYSQKISNGYNSNRSSRNLRKYNKDKPIRNLINEVNDLLVSNRSSNTLYGTFDIDANLRNISTDMSTGYKDNYSKNHRPQKSMFGIDSSSDVKQDMLSNKKIFSDQSSTNKSQLLEANYRAISNLRTSSDILRSEGSSSSVPISIGFTGYTAGALRHAIGRRNKEPPKWTMKLNQNILNRKKDILSTDCTNISGIGWWEARKARDTNLSSSHIPSDAFLFSNNTATIVQKPQNILKDYYEYPVQQTEQSSKFYIERNMLEKEVRNKIKLQLVDNQASEKPSSTQNIEEKQVEEDKSTKSQNNVNSVIDILNKTTAMIMGKSANKPVKTKLKTEDKTIKESKRNPNKGSSKVISKNVEKYKIQSHDDKNHKIDTSIKPSSSYTTSGNNKVEFPLYSSSTLTVPKNNLCFKTNKSNDNLINDKKFISSSDIFKTENFIYDSQLENTNSIITKPRLSSSQIWLKKGNPFGIFSSKYNLQLTPYQEKFLIQKNINLIDKKYQKNFMTRFSIEDVYNTNRNVYTIKLISNKKLFKIGRNLDKFVLNNNDLNSVLSLTKFNNDSIQKNKPITLPIVISNEDIKNKNLDKALDNTITSILSSNKLPVFSSVSRGIKKNDSNIFGNKEIISLKARKNIIYKMINSKYPLYYNLILPISDIKKKSILKYSNSLESLIINLTCNDNTNQDKIENSFNCNTCNKGKILFDNNLEKIKYDEQKTNITSVNNSNTNFKYYSKDILEENNAKINSSIKGPFKYYSKDILEENTENLSINSKIDIIKEKRCNSISSTISQDGSADSFLQPKSSSESQKNSSDESNSVILDSQNSKRHARLSRNFGEKISNLISRQPRITSGVNSDLDFTSSRISSDLYNIDKRYSTVKSGFKSINKDIPISTGLNRTKSRANFNSISNRESIYTNSNNKSIDNQLVHKNSIRNPGFANFRYSLNNERDFKHLDLYKLQSQSMEDHLSNEHYLSTLQDQNTYNREQNGSSKTNQTFHIFNLVSNTGQKTTDNEMYLQDKNPCESERSKEELLVSLKNNLFDNISKSRYMIDSLSPTWKKAYEEFKYKQRKDKDYQQHVLAKVLAYIVLEIFRNNRTQKELVESFPKIFKILNIDNIIAFLSAHNWVESKRSIPRCWGDIELLPKTFLTEDEHKLLRLCDGKSAMEDIALELNSTVKDIYNAIQNCIKKLSKWNTNSVDSIRGQVVLQIYQL